MLGIFSNDGVHPNTGRKAYVLPIDKSLVSLRPQHKIIETQSSNELMHRQVE